MYLFTIVFLSVFAYLEVFNRNTIEKNKIIFTFICFVFLVFHDGFRWETGCDWIPYRAYFDKLFVDYSITEPVFEVGYYLFLVPIRFVTDNYSVYLIVHAVFFYSLLFYTIFKLSISPFVSLLLLYMTIVPFLGTNRQFLAIAIYAISIIALTKEKKTLFVLLIILACFLHRSAIICLVAIFVNRKIKNIYLLIALFIILIIALSGIIDKMSPLLSVLFADESNMDKFDYYTSKSYDVSIVSSILSLMKKFMWVGALMFLDKKIENKPKTYYLFFNLYFIGCLFYLLFNGTVFQILVSRALLYFNIMEILIVPYVLLLLKPNYGKLIVMIVLSLYVIINVQKGFSNYGEGTDYFEPYKGLFINTDYVRQDQ